MCLQMLFNGVDFVSHIAEAWALQILSMSLREHCSIPQILLALKISLMGRYECSKDDGNVSGL